MRIQTELELNQENIQNMDDKNWNSQTGFISKSTDVFKSTTTATLIPFGKSCYEV